MAESALPPPPAKGSLRERERQLDAKSSVLDTHTDIGLAETLSVIRRVLVTFWPLAPVRLAVKALLQMGALGSVALLLPWQAKAVIDNVVLANPIVTTGYPPYLHPVLHWLDGMHPLEILVALSAIAVGMVLTLGYYASGGARDDGVEAGMEQGHDIATATENDMNQGFSHNGGLWGFVEFTLQLRLSQGVNHVLRSQLFSRLAALSMTRLEDQRIGDSVYRVMYDTPAVTTIFYEVVLTPTGSLTIYFAALVGLIGAYPHVPEIIWISASIFPIWLAISACFSRITRRRGQAARAAGSITTSTVEEGMDNILAVQSLGGNKKEKNRFGGDSQGVVQTPPRLPAGRHHRRPVRRLHQRPAADGRFRRHQLQRDRRGAHARRLRRRVRVLGHDAGDRRFRSAGCGSACKATSPACAASSRLWTCRRRTIPARPVCRRSTRAWRCAARASCTPTGGGRWPA